MPGPFDYPFIPLEHFINIDTPSPTPSGEQTMFDIVVTRNAATSTVSARSVNPGTLGIVASGSWVGKTFLHIGTDRFIIMDEARPIIRDTYDYNVLIYPLQSGEAITLIVR